MNIQNKLILGTVQFGMEYGQGEEKYQVDEQESKNILYAARLNGITNIDTAVNYGKAEKIVGELEVKDFKITTKIPNIPNVSDPEKWILNCVKEIRFRLENARGIVNS